jgi:hypothetical protein
MSKPVGAAVVKTIRIDWSTLPSAAAVAAHPPKFPAFDGDLESGSQRGDSEASDAREEAR